MTEQKKTQTEVQGPKQQSLEKQLEPCTRVVGAKVLYVQAHVGVRINHEHVTSFHAEEVNRHPPVSMVATPIGVLCVFEAKRAFPKKRILIPFTNIESIELELGDGA